MGNTIGATLKLNGAAQFKADVTTANKTLATMKSQMSLVKEATKGEENSLESLTKKQTAAQNVFDAYKSKHEALNKALENAKKSYNTIGESVNDYKEKLTKAQTALEDMQKAGASTEELDAQKSEIEKISNSLEKSQKQYQKAGDKVQDWTKQLADNDTQMAKADSELQTLNGYVEEASNSADGCATSIDNFGKNVETATENTSNMEDAINGLTKFEIVSELADKASEAFEKLATATYDAAKEIDSGYDTIVKKTGATGDELGELQTVADNIYSTMPKTMDEIGEAVGEVATKFGGTAESVEDLSTRFLEFATNNDTSVSTSVDNVQQALSAFGLGAESAGTMLDVLNRVAQNTGANVDSISSSMVTNATALQEMGMNAYQAAEFMGELERAGADSATVVSGLKRALKNATEDGQSFDEALAEMQESLVNAKSDTEGLQAAYELFGKSGDAIYNAVKNGQIDFQSLADTESILADSTNNVANTYEATMSTWDKVTVAQNNLKEAGSDLAGEVLVSLEPAIETVTEAIKGVTQWFNKLNPSTKTLIAGFTAVAAGAGIVAPKVIKIATAIKSLQTASKTAKTLSTLTETMKTMNGVQETTEAVTSASAVASTADATAKVGEATATEGATVAQEGFNVALDSCPILLVVTAVAGLAAGLVYLGTCVSSATGDTRELEDATNDLVETANETNDAIKTSLSDIQAQEDSLSASTGIASGLIAELDGLRNQTSLTSEQQERMATIVTQLNGLYPELNLQYDSQTNSLNKTTSQLENYMDTMQRSTQISVYTDAMTEAYEDLVKAEAEVEDLEDQRKDVTDELTRVQQEQADLIAYTNKQTDLQARSQEELNKMLKDGQITSDEYKDAINRVDVAHTTYEGTVMSTEEALEHMTSNVNSLQEQQEKLDKSLGDSNDTLEKAQKTYDKSAEKVSALTHEQEIQDSITTDLLDDYYGLMDASSEYYDRMPGQTASTAELYDAQQKLIEGNSDYYDSLKPSIEVEAEQVEAWNNMSEASQDTATKVTDAVNSLTSNMQSALSSQMSMFDEMNFGAETSLSEMVATMKNNIAGVEEWESNLTELAKMGVDEGLLAELEKAGPEGASKVQAMVQGLKDGSVGLADLNSVWTEYANVQGFENDLAGDLTDAVGTAAAGTEEALTSAMADAGANSVQGLVDGINGAMSQIEEASEEMADTTVDTYDSEMGINSPSRVMKQKGGYVTSGLAQGITSGKSNVTNAMTTVARASITTAQNIMTNSVGTQIGFNMVSGMTGGIYNGQNNVVNAIRNVAEAAVNEAKAKLKINSPSKVFEEIGRYTDEGFVKGILKGQKDVQNTINETFGTDMESAKVSMNNSYNNSGLTASLTRALQNLNLGIYLDGRTLGRTVKRAGVTIG